MDTPSGNGGSDRRARLLKAGALLAVLAVILAAAAWLVSPRLTEYLLLRQLDDLEERTGLEFEVESIETTGLEGVELHRFVISPPGEDEPIAVIDEIHASAELLKAARGRAVISALEIRGVELSIDRRADGTTNLHALLEVDDTEDLDAAPDEGFDSFEDALDATADRLLGHFGGVYPEVLVEDVRADFTHHPDALPWPAERVTMDRFTMSGDPDAASFRTELKIDSEHDDGIRLPDRVEISGTARLPVGRSTVAIDIDPDIRVTSLPGLPHADLALSGLEIPRPYAIEIHAPVLDSHLRDTPHQLASADRIRLDVNRWSLTASEISITDLHIESPRLYIEYNAAGASNLQELYNVVRQPDAVAVADRAATVAEAIAARDAEDDEDDEDVDGVQPPPGLLYRAIDTVANLPIEQWLSEVLPRTTTITDLRLVVDDARSHEDLTNPAARFVLAGDVLELHHSPLQGTVEGDFQFQTRSGDDVGSADIQFKIPYRSGGWNASVEIDDLELALFSQIAGPRLADHLHGGQVMATFDIGNDNDDPDTTRFDGIVSMETARIHHGAIAADAMEVPVASLRMEGFYNPSMQIPEPELIAVEEDEDDDRSDDGESGASDEEDEEALSPPERGGFVVEEAVARLGELEATMGFGLYGLDEERRPTRLDIDVDLQPTELQTIVDSIPAALLGPFDGISFVGTLRWLFSLEVPLYEASEMAWDAHVDLSPDFDVRHIPPKIDVFKLQDQFEHTIEEEWTGRLNFRERDFSYERTVTIPEARPTPVDWFLDNTTFDLEDIDAIWRRRGWPPVPEWHPNVGVSREVLASPRFWHTPAAQTRIADTPWDDDDDDEDRADSSSPWQQWQAGGDDAEEQTKLVYENASHDPFDYAAIPSDGGPVRIDSERYGPYVYVPLHHISPYMVRAIMTTEDTGFFTHSGFNYLAIRQSVEANIEAGRYVRGASTISMQLARNLFLDRSRVLARKFQEVALVWLMESVADIPKERMMELYLNIIEFGPGVYGIHEAAMHYFGKRPDELTIGESAWLVSIVPSPKRYHQYYDRGEITATWAHRMRRYIRAMKYRDRLSRDEMEAALEEEVTFYIPEDGDPLLRNDLAEDDEIEPDDVDPDDDLDDGELTDDLLFD